MNGLYVEEYNCITFTKMTTTTTMMITFFYKKKKSNIIALIKERFAHYKVLIKKVINVNPSTKMGKITKDPILLREYVRSLPSR